MIAKRFGSDRRDVGSPLVPYQESDWVRIGNCWTTNVHVKTCFHRCITFDFLQRWMFSPFAIKHGCISLAKLLIRFSFNRIIFSAWAVLCIFSFKVRRPLLGMHFQRQKKKMFHPWEENWFFNNKNRRCFTLNYFCVNRKSAILCFTHYSGITLY